MLTKTILRKGIATAVTGLAGTALVSKAVPEYVKKDLEKNKTRKNPETFEKQMNKYTAIMISGEAAVLGVAYVVGKLI